LTRGSATGNTDNEIRYVHLADGGDTGLVIWSGEVDLDAYWRACDPGPAAPLQHHYGIEADDETWRGAALAGTIRAVCIVVGRL
jgi:hypothetical protein